MEQLRSQIIEITKSRPEIGSKYYEDLLDIINDHHGKKPDTSIETCKSLLEGISKLIIHKIKQEPLHVLDKSKDVKSLTKQALDALNDEMSYFDSDFIRSIVNIVRVLGEIRNNHSDIGHGRASIKKQLNTEDFSEMISGVTQSLSIYLLKKLDEILIDENHYDAEHMQPYNQWLDDNNLDFPIKGEKYSKLLFKYDRDLYNITYREEYQESIPSDQFDSTKDDIDYSHVVIRDKKPFQIDSEYFDNINQKQLIIDFVDKEMVKPESFTLILDKYFFDNEFPI